MKANRSGLRGVTELIFSKLTLKASRKNLHHVMARQTP